MFYRISKT